MKNKKWFSLLEVIVASWILTITIFWIYKLIAENTKLISHSMQYKQWNMLFLSIKECIDYFWTAVFTWSIQTWYSFNFWPNNLQCLTWVYDIGFNFSWVTLWDKTYYLYWEIINTWSNFVEWNLWVYNDEIWEIRKKYKDYN